MVKTLSLEEQDHAEPGRPASRTGKHRCGFCLTGNHEACCSAVYWDKNKQLYICPCDCNRGKTRCTRCGRRGATVTNDTSQCIDVEDCDGYLARKREANPLIVTKKAAPEATDGTSEPLGQRPTTRNKAGACLCCGRTTKGGLFLPGHDARFLSQKSTEWLACEPDERAKIYAALEERLSPALIAKFVKRVTA